jgi:hypothetical protein
MFQRESWGGILYDDWSNAFPEQTTWWTTWVLFSPIFDGKNTYMKPHGLPVKIFPKSFHWIESSGQSLEWSMDSLGLKLVFFCCPKREISSKIQLPQVLQSSWAIPRRNFGHFQRGFSIWSRLRRINFLGLTPEKWGFTRPGKHRKNWWEQHPAFNGWIHYFDWAIFNSKLLVYQRVHNKKQW